MVVDIGVPPRYIRSFSFSPKAVLSDADREEYLYCIRNKIFGPIWVANVNRLGLDLFDLVFVNGKPFCDCYESFSGSVQAENAESFRTALLVRRLCKGDTVKIAKVEISGDVAYVTDPEIIQLPEKKKKKSAAKDDSDAEAGLNKRANLILESVRLAALKYTMQRCMDYKELVDKYNFRRFSTRLRLNNRPADIEEINAAMAVRKDMLFADFSKENTRINFSMLYAIAYGGYTMEDIFSRDSVFDNRGYEREKRLSDLSSELLTILYNANGIEISGMLINLIISFTRLELPPVDLKDLSSVIEYYPVYYAIANLAAILESIFTSDTGIKAEMKEYLKRHTFYNYWTVTERLSLMKQYSKVVSFCYKLANFDIEMYREEPEYQGTVLYSFESAQKFAEELEKIE